MYVKRFFLQILLIAVASCESDKNNNSTDKNADNKVCQIEKEILSLKTQISNQDATIATQSVRVAATNLNSHKLNKDASSLAEQLLKQQRSLETLEGVLNTKTDRRQELHSCPNGYIQHDRSCYRIHHDELSWPEAYLFCEAFDSHLVIENTVEEHAFLKQKALEVQGSYTGRAYWISAFDAVSEGRWRWTDTNVNANILWGPRQPNNGVVSNCACLWKGFQYEVADEPCRNTYNFICEIELANG